MLCDRRGRWSYWCWVMLPASNWFLLPDARWWLGADGPSGTPCCCFFFFTLVAVEITDEELERVGDRMGSGP